MKKIRVGINGFGRIGRAFLKVAWDHPELEVVAVNDLGSIENFAYLLKYDTVYHTWEKDVKVVGTDFEIDGRKVKYLSEKDATKLPWGDLKIDVVVESTGLFTSYDKANVHIGAGAKKVVISAPAKGSDGSVKGETILLGINEEKFGICEERCKGQECSVTICASNEADKDQCYFSGYKPHGREVEGSCNACEVAKDCSAFNYDEESCERNACLEKAGSDNVKLQCGWLEEGNCFVLFRFYKSEGDPYKFQGGFLSDIAKKVYGDESFGMALGYYNIEKAINTENERDKRSYGLFLAWALAMKDLDKVSNEDIERWLETNLFKRKLPEQYLLDDKTVALDDKTVAPFLIYKPSKGDIEYYNVEAKQDFIIKNYVANRGFFDKFLHFIKNIPELFVNIKKTPKQNIDDVRYEIDELKNKIRPVLEERANVDCIQLGYKDCIKNSAICKWEAGRCFDIGGRCLSCENKIFGGIKTACTEEVCHGEKEGRFGNTFGPECVYLGEVGGADCRPCVNSCEDFNVYVNDMKKLYSNNERFLEPILHNLKEDCTGTRCNIKAGCEWVNDECKVKTVKPTVTASQALPVKKCEDCGKDNKACNLGVCFTLGNCFYDKETSKCLYCTAIKDCGDYGDIASCNADKCGLKNCKFEKNICEITKLDVRPQRSSVQNLAKPTSIPSQGAFYKLYENYLTFINSPLKNLNLGYCVWDAERKTGIPAEVTLAIALHESLTAENGKLVMTNLAGDYKNYFGIKCKNDTPKCVEKPANEFDKRYEGKDVVSYATFTGACDSTQYITNRIKSGVVTEYAEAMNYVNDPKKFITTIGKVYATDQSWSDKIIDKYNGVVVYKSNNVPA